MKNDTVDLQRFEDVCKKGAIALPSVTEARRSVLGSSTRALETTAALTAVEREPGELNRCREKLSDVRRMERLHDLQEATATAAGPKTKLQAVTTKLRYRSRHDTTRPRFRQPGASRDHAVVGRKGQQHPGVGRHHPSTGRCRRIVSPASDPIAWAPWLRVGSAPTRASDRIEVPDQ